MQDDLKKKSDEYWKQKLTPEEYEVLRSKGTEAPFSGEYYLNHETGMYQCAGCGQELFSSEHKFDSDCGWPSFDDPVQQEHVELVEDNKYGMRRTEVVCKNCGGHLGHLFNDGPTPNGNRYCINSRALHFKPQK